MEARPSVMNGSREMSPAHCAAQAVEQADKGNEVQQAQRSKLPLIHKDLEVFLRQLRTQPVVPSRR